MMEITAKDLHRLAVYYCKKGDHRQAADTFERAGDLHTANGKCYEAAACYAQAISERRWIRPTPPPNISALVD